MESPSKIYTLREGLSKLGTSSDNAYLHGNKKQDGRVGRKEFGEGTSNSEQQHTPATW